MTERGPIAGGMTLMDLVARGEAPELEAAMAARRSGVPLGDMIRLSAERSPGNTCYIDSEGVNYTFAEVNQRVNRLASALRARGVGRGDRVAIFAVDCVPYLETILATLKLGAVYVALNYRLQTEEVCNLIAVAGPKALMVSARYEGHVAAIRQAAPDLTTVVCVDGEIEQAIAYPDLLAEGSPEDILVLATDDDIISIAFTSGTTGAPKGVLQSHRMFKAMLVQRLYYFQVGQDELRYSAAPSYHIGGIGMTMLGVFAGYGHLILPQFDAATVQRYLSTGGLTGVFLVPTMISTLLQMPETLESDYPDLKLIIYGSAPMSPALLRRAMDTFDCDFIDAFGGTEPGMQMVLTAADHRMAAAGRPHLLESIGRPVVNLDVKLCDEDLQPVKPGEVGEIVTRGETIMSGYLGQPERTAQTLLPGGWIRCGDLASVDEDGYYYLAGRRDDMIIRGGENVYPVEIEATLCDLPGVEEAVIIGVPDEHWGQTVRAYVRLRHEAVDAGFDEAGAATFLKERLAAYKVPAEFVVVEEFPRNASGKVLRTELRRQAVPGK